jgi:hypothetical protein
MPIDELIQVLNITNRTNPTNYILLNDAIAKIDTENITTNKLTSVWCEYEVLFMIKLYQSGFKKENYTIKQSENKYSYIDFVIRNIKTKKRVYIELKTRSKEYEKYENYFIGTTKVYKIKHLGLTPCLFCWDFKNLNKLYFMDYDNDYIEKCNKNVMSGSWVYEIPKTKMTCGWSALLNRISELID